MLREGFEPATPATKQPQSYALDRAATGIGFKQPTNYSIYLEQCSSVQLRGDACEPAADKVPETVAEPWQKLYQAHYIVTCQWTHVTITTLHTAVAQTIVITNNGGRHPLQESCSATATGLKLRKLQDVPERTDLHSFLTLFNNTVITLKQLIQELPRRDTQTVRQNVKKQFTKICHCTKLLNSIQTGSVFVPT
jgi:hypothetical protein